MWTVLRSIGFAWLFGFALACVLQLIPVGRDYWVLMSISVLIYCVM